MLRHHDSCFRDQPSHDTEHRIRAACIEPDCIQSVQYALLHCWAYSRRRAAFRAKIAHLPEADGTPPILTDDDGLVAPLAGGLSGNERSGQRSGCLLTCIVKEIERGAVWG